MTTKTETPELKLTKEQQKRIFEVADQKDFKATFPKGTVKITGRSFKFRNTVDEIFEEAIPQVELSYIDSKDPKRKPGSWNTPLSSFQAKLWTKPELPKRIQEGTSFTTSNRKRHHVSKIVFDAQTDDVIFHINDGFTDQKEAGQYGLEGFKSLLNS